MVGGGVPSAAAPRNGAPGGGVADYNSQRALRRRGVLPPPRGPPAGPAVPARPGEHGRIAPPVLEERSEGFISATEFLAVRSEQQGPHAVGGLLGVGGSRICVAVGWPGDRHRPRPLERPGCHPEHKAVLPQRPPCEISQERVLAVAGVAALRCFITVELACGKDNEN